MLVVLLMLLETPPENDLRQFAVPLHCLNHCNRNIDEEFRILIDRHKADVAYWVGRDRGIRHAVVGELELRQYAWVCLASYADYPCCYWANELRLTIGDAAFACGVMPPFPTVVGLAFRIANGF